MGNSNTATLRVLVIAAVVAWPHAAIGSDSQKGPPELGIEEVVAAALSAGYEIQIAEGGLASAKAQSDLAASKLGLSLSGSASYSLSEAFGAELSGPSAQALSRLVGSKGASHSLQGSLSLNAGASSKLTLTVSESIPPASGSASGSIGASLAQTIWDGYPGGQALAAYKKAGIAYQAREIAAAQTRSTIAANAKRSYVAVLTAQRTVALRMGALERQSALLRQIETTYALAQASEVDLMSARLNARTAELDLETARHELDSATRKLAALMGRDPSDDFAVRELEEPMLPVESVEEAVAIGLSRRADAAQLELNRRSAEIDLALAEALRHPGVTASAGLTMGFVGGNDPSEAFQASLGAKLSLPILDAGAAAAQASAARASLEVLKAQTGQLSRNIESDIRDAYRMATILRDRIAVAADAKALADKKLELVRTQLMYGTATNQDLMDAQNAASNAGAAYLKAKGDYFLQEIALESAMGM